MSGPGLLARLRTFVRRGRVLSDYDAEVASHLDLLQADLERQGYSRDAARREARRRFGGQDQAREAFRDASGFPTVDALAGDLRYAFRMLRRQPGFSLLVVMLVAVGVGATTAIFSLVNAVLIRPLSYPQPDRLAVVRSVVPAMSASYPSVPAAAGGFLLWRDRATAFEAMAALSPRTQTLAGTGEPARVEVLRATSALLPMLGAHPAAGRLFRADEDRDGAPHVAVVTDGFWRQRMNGDLSAVGRAIILDDTSYTVVGVLPPDFRFPRGEQLGGLVGLPSRLDVIRPAAFTADDRETLAGDFDWAALGRLAPGATFAQAEAQINAVQADIVRQMGLQNIELKAVIVPLHEQVVGQARRGLVLLGWSVTTVLLVMAVNLANLLLTRISARTGEAAIRTALGATRVRVMRQVVLENLLLAGTGGLLGVGVAWAAIHLLALGAPVDLPRLDEVHLDPTVFAVAVSTSLLTGLLISLAPAWRLSRANPQASLRASARGASDTTSQMTLRSSLVALEVALSTVLIAASALLATSFSRLLHVDTGFAADRVAFAAIAPSLDRYDSLAARTALDDRLLERLRRLPGVSAVSLASEAPLQGEAHVRTMSTDRETRPLDQRPVANVRYVDARYFDLLGIRLTAGRWFDGRDRTRDVALVNQRLAAAMWPGQNPIGQQLRQGNEHHPLMEVIGVVGDTRDVSLYKMPYLMAYVPYWTDGADPSASLLIRTDLPADTIAPVLQRAIWDVDPTIPAPAVTTFQESVRRSVAPDRFQLLLVLGFALSAVVLAALGIYGVPAFAVAQRSQELGIRLALGAAPAALVRMVVRQGLLPVAIGLTVGLGGAVIAGRLMQSLLFDATGVDARVLLAVPAGIALIALVACYLPARRAARIDPVQAMRCE